MTSRKLSRGPYSLVAMIVLATVLCLAVGGVLATPPDWLIANITTEVTLEKDGASLTLTNGLISRHFTTEPAFGTVDFRSEVKQRSILRMVYEEANVTLDGTEYRVGGLQAAADTHAYLNRSLLNLTADPNAFQFAGYSTASPQPPFHWEPGLRHSPPTSSWPPKGLTLRVKFLPPSSAKPPHTDVVVYVNYEMYVGVPLLAKWVSVEYSGAAPVVVSSVVVEYLATQKPYAPFEYSQYPRPWDHGPGITSSWLYLQSNEPHGSWCGMVTDPMASVDYGADEPIMKCHYPLGPAAVMGSTANTHSALTTLDTFRALELVTDSSDRERVGLSRHRLTRLLAPQAQENPIFFHSTDSTDIGFKVAVQQMVEVGFEMYIYSFGQSFKMEDTDPSYIQHIASQVQYAREHGLEVGGYDLIDLARGDHTYGPNVGYQWDCVGDDGTLTSNACFASGWYDKLHGIVFNFINRTGLSMIETDGPYGGQTCASVTHTHHQGYSDSVFHQNRLQMQFYTDLKTLNIFINQPDNYFFQGGNKVAMGYNERQYNLPRWQDLTVSRQGMYDDTYYHLPTQGWMFLPLVQYHGGGTPAEFDPPSEYYLEYEWGLAQYMGYGVAPCYRGPRLYDSIPTMQLVQKWVGFFKKYRDILISDIVHVRRPDMQSYDCILHVNPFITNRGLAMVFNPTSFPISANLSLPLYYTGISSKALVMPEGVSATTYELGRDYSISLPLDMGPKTITWFLIQSAD